MTAPLTVSVIVVSRGRPALLNRCLTSISQVWHDNFEVIVVADKAGRAAIEPWRHRIKLHPFDEANISRARNIGIDLAAGEVVAFIDDDAVPEPTWLTNLTAPFRDTEVAQTGGFVRGRNGISFQWRGRVVDRLGRTREVQDDGQTWLIPEVAEDEAIKTEGTNMALRRSVIAGIGGFDPAYRYFLDETDVNLRLADRRTVIVPQAQVHHGFAASDNRTADRVPTDLTEIGASWAVFLRKHAPSRLQKRFDTAFREQQSRLRNYRRAGRLTAEDLERLEATFFAGFDDGMARSIETLPPLGPPKARFKRFVSQASGSSELIAGRPWSRQRLAMTARTAVTNGSVPTVLCLSPTPRSHRMRFHPDGYWEQRGGLFGPSDRTQPRFRLWSFRKRVAAERTRIGTLRNF